MHFGNALKSTWFFSKLLFFKKEYDVIFIYRNTFIREGGTNHLLKPFIESCDRFGISYLLLESRHHQAASGHRYLCDTDAVPYNLISFLQRKLRRIFGKTGIVYDTNREWVEREEKVANVLQKLFFRNLQTKLFITLVGNNNMAFLKSIYTDTLFAEYQHGIFWCHYDSKSLREHRFLRKTQNRNTILLLYGEGFARVRAICPEAMAYPDENLRVIGSYFSIPDYRQRDNYRTILYTLQNIDMGSNESYYAMIKEVINHNADFLQKGGYRILFKNHPRYERNDPLHFEEEYPFISFIGDEEPMGMLDDVSIHITSKSTTALDAALHSVPTIFIDMLEVRSPKEILFDQYHYPLENFRVERPPALAELLRSLEDQDYYRECSRKAYEWACEYYQDFDKQVLFDLLNQSKPVTRQP